MNEFKTFAGIQTMPSEIAKVPNNSSTTNAAEQNNEYIRDQYIREEVEKRLKEKEKKGKKATKKEIKKIVKTVGGILNFSRGLRVPLTAYF